MTSSTSPSRAASGVRFDVFISYSTKDRFVSVGGRRFDLLTTLKRELEKHTHPATGRRFRVCTDHEDFELSDSTRATIVARLGAAQSLLVLCSEHSRASEYVQFEIAQFPLINPGALILGAHLGLLPATAFPSTFQAETLGANFVLPNDCTLSEWRRCIENESHKVVATVWQLPLALVHDRFAAEQRILRRRRMIWIGVALLTLAVVTGWALKELSDRREAEQLSRKRHYAADIARVYEAWAEGKVSFGQQLLRSYIPSSTNPAEDLRGFEWYHFWRIFHAERFKISHTSLLAVGEIAFVHRNPDGTYLSDTASGRQIATLGRDFDDATTAAFSPNGELVVLATRTSISLLDSRGRVTAAVPMPGTSQPVAVAVANSRRMAVADSDGTLHLFDHQRSPQRPRAAEASTRSTLFLSFTPDETRLLVVGIDGTLEVLDGTTLARRAPTLKVSPLPEDARSIDVAHVALVPAGDGVLVWDYTRGTTHEVSLPRTVIGVAISPDGETVATIGNTVGAIYLWRATDLFESRRWYPLGSFKHVPGFGDFVKFANNGTRLISSSWANETKGWDVRAVGRRVIPIHEADIASLAVTPDGRAMVTGSRGKEVAHVELRTGRVRWKRQLDMDVRWVAVAPRRRLVAVGGWQGAVLLKLTSGEPFRTLIGYGPVAISPDERWLAWAGEQPNAVMLHDLQSGSTSSLASSSVDDVVAVAFSADSSTLLTGAVNGAMMGWDVEKRAVTFRLSGHEKPIDTITCSRDGQWLMTTSMDLTAKVWTTKKPRLVAQLHSHTSSVYTGAFSPDAKTLVTGSRDSYAKLWNFATTQEMATFSAHAAWAGHGVTGASFTADGRNLLTAGSGGVVFVWETAQPSDVLKVMPLPPALRFRASVARFPETARRISATGPRFEDRRHDTVARSHLRFSGKVRSSGPRRAFPCRGRDGR